MRSLAPEFKRLLAAFEVLARFVTGDHSGEHTETLQALEAQANKLREEHGLPPLRSKELWEWVEAQNEAFLSPQQQRLEALAKQKPDQLGRIPGPR